MKAPANDRFDGFSAEGLALLRGLAKNNRREWFQPRKALFEKTLLEPLKALVVDATSAMRSAKIPLSADPSRAPFRIYRDIRFSLDKRPYKTNVGAYLSQGGLHDGSGGLYVHIQPERSFMAMAFYQLDRPALERWRRAMAKKPARFQAMLRALRRHRLTMSDEHETLRRMPRGYESMASSPIAKYFRMSSFMVSERLTDEDVSSPRLVGRMVRFAKKAKPLLDFGRTID